MTSRQFDLPRIQRATGVRRIEYFAELESTNSRALQLARQDEGDVPLLVLAERQTAGRGRGGHRWYSTDGALTFSLLLQPPPETLPRPTWTLISLTAGLAVCEALSPLVPGLQLGLKWPNDVYLQRPASRPDAERSGPGTGLPVVSSPPLLPGFGKLGGVLIESPAHPAGRLVVGIGVNVNNSLADAPSELQCTAISLRDAASQEFSLTAALILILQSFAELLGLLSVAPEAVRQRWNDRSLLSGRQVAAEIAGVPVSGTCHGIAADGALLIEAAGQLQRCVSGTVLAPSETAEILARTEVG